MLAPQTSLALLMAVPLAGGPATIVPVTIRVRLQPSVSKATLDIPLEKYVAAVLAGESSVLRSDEAMKAMAVAARTYAIHFRGRHSAEGYDLCGTTHCQHLDPGAVTQRLESIANETAGQLLWYQGKLALACYSRNCGGITEDAAAVWSTRSAPYLCSHPDPYCTRQGPSAWHWSAHPLDIATALRRWQLKIPPGIPQIDVVQHTASGRARVLVLSGNGEPIRISASSFRFAMGRGLGWNTVRSDRFDIQPLNGRLLFQGSGEGHGVGLCQRGADRMGVEGHSYREILAFYYPGTAVGLSDSRGKGVSLLPVLPYVRQPARDSPSVCRAEAAAVEWF
jgi:stage II sporulation protein D